MQTCKFTNALNVLLKISFAFYPVGLPASSNSRGCPYSKSRSRGRGPAMRDVTLQTLNILAHKKIHRPKYYLSLSNYNHLATCLREMSPTGLCKCNFIYLFISSVFFHIFRLWYQRTYIAALPLYTFFDGMLCLSFVLCTTLGLYVTTAFQVWPSTLFSCIWFVDMYALGEEC